MTFGRLFNPSAKSRVSVWFASQSIDPMVSSRPHDDDDHHHRVAKCDVTKILLLEYCNFGLKF